jgi:hypothetical protein
MSLQEYGWLEFEFARPKFYDPEARLVDVLTEQKGLSFVLRPKKLLPGVRDKWMRMMSYQHEYRRLYEKLKLLMQQKTPVRDRLGREWYVEKIVEERREIVFTRRPRDLEVTVK